MRFSRSLAYIDTRTTGGGLVVMPDVSNLRNRDLIIGLAANTASRRSILIQAS
jgi:hypothetical protein